MAYTYTDLLTEMIRLYEQYPFIEVFHFGQSVMGKPLFGMKIGTGENKVLYVSAHHSLEWLTSAMIMSFAAIYAEAIQNNEQICSYNAKELAEKTSMYIIPMLNPDGIDLVAGKIGPENVYYQNIISQVGEIDFGSLWQANINGVDLNHNYDASFDPILSSPAPSRYGGLYPESEPESRALANLTREIEPDIVVAFHSQGREIYYDFEGYVPPEGENIAQQFAFLSGYKATTPEGTAAFGGYKDWFIKEFNKPGFTVEIGIGKNPIDFSQLEDVVRENTCLMIYGAAAAAGLSPAGESVSDESEQDLSPDESTIPTDEI